MNTGLRVCFSINGAGKLWSICKFVQRFKSSCKVYGKDVYGVNWLRVKKKKSRKRNPDMERGQLLSDIDVYKYQKKVS